MDLINPDNLQLVPGESIGAMFSTGPESPEQVGLFLRSAFGIPRGNGDLGIMQRAGLIQFNDVLLVLTMVKLDGPADELFDIWWNYHSRRGDEQFKRMAEQDRLTVHFYSETGKDFTIDAENGFQRFFSNLHKHFERVPSWTEVEFDRAVRGFCAQAYPKENLWDMIEFSAETDQSAEKDETVDPEAYVQTLPEELRPFYVYLADKGHCIRIVPSTFEQEASDGNPEDYLHPAPVKTVLRCGIRWTKGYPVAPIPFIPGHGLAVPPDDQEF
ncbi:MAG: hypothetical protein HY913_01540 [Desulfomonile tiedjei]|nr:hypothetical protein [Desulfomonile tiedjei]